MTSPEVYVMQAFLSKLKNKTIPEISEACIAKIRALENSSAPDHNLQENLKGIVLLIRHLRKPSNMNNEELINLLVAFFTEVEKYDRRAKHVLSIIKK